MQPNARQVSADIPAPLLTYSLTTQPMPVQVSLSATSLSNATLTFVVSCPKKTSTFPGEATVAAIEIMLPVDTGGTENPANLCITAPLESDVSISSSNQDEVWQASPAGAPGAFYFMLQNDEPVLFSDQSLTIEFSNVEINTLVGTALVTISEWAVPGIGTPTTPDDGLPSGKELAAVAKFPYGFYAGNFTSDKPMVNNGETPVLSWTGSANATYLMLYESNVVDVSDVQSWSPPNGLTQMTTFILQVSAQQEGQTATMDFSLTIEVENPSLNAQDLTVLTTSTLKGPVNVGASGAPANLLVNGDLTAVGQLNAQTGATIGTLNVTGTATLSSTLTVSGGVTLNNTLNVTGDGKFSGGLTSTNSLTATGAVSVFGTMVSLALGSYTAGTDGFVIGSVMQPASNSSTRFYDLSIYCMCGAYWVQATGGGTLQANAGGTNWYQVPTAGTFIMPVPKGSAFTLGLIPSLKPTLQQPLYQFLWVPLGSAPLSPALTSTGKPSRKLTARSSAAKKKLAPGKKPTTKKKPVKKSRKH